MITVRTKGVPLTKPLPVDDEGYAVFKLDDDKFDPFDVMLRTFAKCGRVDPPTDPRCDAMMRERAKPKPKAK